MNERVNLNDVVRITNPDYPDFVLQGLVQGIYQDGDMRLEGTEAYTEALMGPEAYRGRKVEVIRRAKRELPTEEGIYYAELPNEKPGSGLIYKRLFKRKFDGWFDVAGDTQTEKTEYLEKLVNSEISPWTLVRLVPEQQ